MTKKHFIAIAEILAHGHADSTLINLLSAYFETQNVSYDHDRFAAHIEDVKKEMADNV